MLIAVAVNPHAFFGRARHAGKEAAGRFRAAGAEVLLLCTDSYAGLAQAVEDALESGVGERANGWRWRRGRIRYQLAMLHEPASCLAINDVVTADGVRWQQGAC
jgi:NAD(P)-dependent dehydrogenase (short-subunit alcohol dehydrogenase family)